VSATEMSITSGGREVSLNVYAHGGMRHRPTAWFQESPENKNPNGEDVTGTLDSLRMDGGYSHTLDLTRKPTRGEEEKRRLGSTKDFLHKCSDHGSDACDMKPCDEAFEKDNFHTNLDGSKCFVKNLDARVKCMYTKNSMQYRPNYSSNTTSLCPGKFISLRNDYDGSKLVAPVSNPNWSWCTGGDTVNTDYKSPHTYVPMLATPLKMMCRADEYGNTKQCRSKLKLQVFECATCKCAQLVTMTISHGLESSSDKGACKPWFVHADSGVRAYIAQYREKLLQQKSKEC